MRFSIVRTIAEREILEYLNNSQAVLMLALNVCLNVFLSFTLGTSLMVITLNMSLVMMGFMNTMMLFAEEKDQNTLKAVMTTPARFEEIIIGKLLVNFTITLICTLGLFLALHFSEISVVHLLFAATLGALIFCLLGMCLGIAVPNQKVANSYGSIIMMLFFLPELMAPVNEHVGHFARGLPSFYLNQVLSISKLATFEDVSKYYIVILLFAFTSLFLVYSFIKNLLVQESSKWEFSLSNKVALGGFVALVILSSYLFKPVQWQTTENEGRPYLSHSAFELSIPKPTKEKYSKRIVNGANKSTLIFKRKDDEKRYLFVKVLRNWKKQSLKEYLDQKVKKWKSSKDISHIEFIDSKKLKGYPTQLIEFKDQEGANRIFYSIKDEWIYQIGFVERGALIVSEKAKEELKDFFQKVY